MAGGNGRRGRKRHQARMRLEEELAEQDQVRETSPEVEEEQVPEVPTELPGPPHRNSKTIVTNLVYQMQAQQKEFLSEVHHGTTWKHREHLLGPDKKTYNEVVQVARVRVPVEGQLLRSNGGVKRSGRESSGGGNTRPFRPYKGRTAIAREKQPGTTVPQFADPTQILNVITVMNWDMLQGTTLYLRSKLPKEARVYAITTEEAAASPDVVTGIINVAGLPARVLFDFGATHSFVSISFGKRMELPIKQLNPSLIVRSPLGVEVALTKYYGPCMVCIEGRDLEASLVILEMADFDVILGMDWLGHHSAVLLCGERKLVLHRQRGKGIQFTGIKLSRKRKLILSALKTKRCLEKGGVGYLGSVVDLTESHSRWKI
ncbi:hypothetical protein NE237_021172 [Protea cynaroides]|uniref:Reverse transcriptase domain-containing protein n=1 Tax=Protea cynaroides TaxID=273540 RepID=A0A9Q0K3A2_9MAGN|nr:hypothetical protein NE237_021172 [Protea cynaroides]